jgi:hypothetical protein
MRDLIWGMGDPTAEDPMGHPIWEVLYVRPCTSVWEVLWGIQWSVIKFGDLTNILSEDEIMLQSNHTLTSCDT